MQNCQRHASWQSIASVDVGRLAQDELSVMHRGACLYRASTQADACARGRVQNCGGTGRPFAIGRLNDITMETLQSPAVANSASPAAMNSTPAENVLPSAPSDDAAVQIVSLYQAQKKIYPRAVTGVFIAWRWAFVWLTQLVFYGTPWLVWNGRQAVLFDLGTRRFYVFGLVLYPQDFIYMTALLLISAYSLFLFTTVAGRLWCGYACPQTVYTELFMWVERKLEGDRAARMKRDANRWRFDTLWRKSAKHGAWIAMGLWTGFTFVGYFTPIHTLAAEVASLGLGPWETFWVLFYGFATYGNAGFMREQVCKYMCPYARFQSAMLDKDTLIITYDEARGEPRFAVEEGRPQGLEPGRLH